VVNAASPFSRVNPALPAPAGSVEEVVGDSVAEFLILLKVGMRVTIEYWENTGFVFQCATMA
jgi:hypothetical protein